MKSNGLLKKMQGRHIKIELIGKYLMRLLNLLVQQKELNISLVITKKGFVETKINLLFIKRLSEKEIFKYVM